jgi:hypothetical protein
MSSESFEADAGELDADSTDEGRLPSQPRVAVDVLQLDQQRVLFDGEPDRTPPITPLTEAFDSRRAVINWWQATAVRTFGRLRELLPAPAIIREPTLTDALTAAAPTDGQAHTRERLQEHVIAACSSAYRDLETRAHEWLPGDDGSPGDGGHQDYRQIDPEHQQHIAMRPAFSRLDTGQSRALAQLWGGFEDREAVTRWTHKLPAVAKFDAVTPPGTGLTEWIVTDPTALAYLTRPASDDDARAVRERFAATVLLPAFGERAESLQGGALARSGGTENPWNEVRD